MNESLEARDVRAIVRLLSELREMGAQPSAWRAHLAATLEVLCDASTAIVAELRRSGAHAVAPLQLIAHDLDVPVRERFLREVQSAWDRSFTADQRSRAFGSDDLVLSMMPVRERNVMCGMAIHRDHETPFTNRERVLLAILHEELANDWRRTMSAEPVRLTSRQREIVARLAEGMSEKEITYDLGLSAHTTHDHVKAIYRALEVRSRGELLARLSRPSPARTRLVAEL